MPPNGLFDCAIKRLNYVVQVRLDHLNLVLLKQFSHDSLQLPKSLGLDVFVETLQTGLKVEEVSLFKLSCRLKEVKAEQDESLVKGHAPFVDRRRSTQFELSLLLTPLLLHFRLEVNPLCQFVVVKTAFFCDGARDSLH